MEEPNGLNRSRNAEIGGKLKKASTPPNTGSLNPEQRIERLSETTKTETPLTRREYQSQY